MMTKVGRIALFVNLALSLMFGFWGFGIYSQRINWTDKKLGDREGIYALNKARIDKLNTKARPVVEANWARALKGSGGVLALEDLRPKRQVWYNEQIELLRTGNANQKILGVDVQQGRIVLDPATGLPALRPVVDQTKKPIAGLASLRVLNDNYRRLQQEILMVTGDIEKLVAQEKALTEQLGEGVGRGLRFDLAQQQLAERKSLAEQEFLQPLLYNSMVEQQSLEGRRKVLEARLKQLQAISVARQP